jgi:asparagine synthase (glutamine-hydrolysing)
VVLESHTDELIDRNAVLRLLDEHRAGTLDHSRRIWALVVFMIWHGIFIEDRIKPEIPEPHYPVRL